MRKTYIGFIGFSDPYWNHDYVNKEYNNAKNILQEIAKKEDISLVLAPSVVISDEDLVSVLKKIHQQNVEGLILHTTAQTDGDRILEIGGFLSKNPMPVIIWSTREHYSGHMKANTFTSLQFFTALLHRQRIEYKWIYGDIDEHIHVSDKLTTSLRTLKIIAALKGARLLSIGGKVPGFYLCNYDELALRKRFGVIIESFDLHRIFLDAEKISSNEVAVILQSIKKESRITCTNKESVEKGIRIFLVIKNLVKKHNYAGVTLRCWPEFMEVYGATACLSLSLLIDNGIITSDEGDIGGLISMLIQYYANKRKSVPTLFDLIGFDEEKNTILLWHCGASPLSLKDKNAKAIIFDSPILSSTPGGAIGPVIEAQFKTGTATIVRFSGENCSRYFSFSGDVINTSPPIHGAYVEIKPKNIRVRDIINTALSGGCEYHMSFAYSEHTAIINEMAQWLYIEKIENIPYQNGNGAFAQYR